MNITKLEHACMVVEIDGKRLVIDPGNFTKSLTDLENIVGIVITHVHADHFDTKLVDTIIKANPDAVIVSVKEVTDQLKDTKKEKIDAGDTRTVGPFALEFFGGRHAYIHDQVPQNQNVGVLVNETLYFPGDSFSPPGNKSIKVAAVPVSGPWLKFGEAMDFIRAVKPERVFPAHDGFLSEGGQYFTDRWLGDAEGIEYYPLRPGESLSID